MVAYADLNKKKLPRHSRKKGVRSIKDREYSRGGVIEFPSIHREGQWHTELRSSLAVITTGQTEGLYLPFFRIF